ncbi:MAG: hypothetical protein ACR2PJ_07445 [Pseudomonadales bacterium]
MEFVPISDATLFADSDLHRRLVPFNPNFRVAGQKPSQGRKPRNWIADCDGQQARARLYATQA